LSDPSSGGSIDIVARTESRANRCKLGRSITAMPKWYATCESGHPYWAGVTHDKYSDAQTDADVHDTQAHGGVRTASVLDADGTKAKVGMNLEPSVLSTCDGNACSAIRIAYPPDYPFSGGSPTIANNSSRAVTVKFDGYAQAFHGFTMTVNPGESKPIIPANGWKLPYHANYSG
jgi:hypothetical protein